MKREIKFRKWHKELTDMTFWDGSKGSNNLFWHTLTEYPEMYVLMQFTGLNDENGKEIYEGDIVNTLHGTLAVEFNDDTCKFQFSNGMDINDREMYGMSKMIIGNIYENENLLT
jgi:uncharacterized phage protein (TIGR01671 family)